MIGNAVKCDVCGKVDVHESNQGVRFSLNIKWFRVTAPQVVEPEHSIETADICSMKCVQEYAEGWTYNE